MKTLEIVVLVIAAFISIAWIYGIRSQFRRGALPTRQTINATMLFAVSMTAVLISDISPFHLLWMFPSSIVVGMLSLAFPFSLLSIPGTAFGRICLLGVHWRAVQANQTRENRFVELQRSGLMPEEAAKQVVEELGRPD